jgi:hypothetical protein
VAEIMIAFNIGTFRKSGSWSFRSGGWPCAGSRQVRMQ